MFIRSNAVTHICPHSLTNISDKQGRCDLDAISPPLLNTPPTYYHHHSHANGSSSKDGVAQMAHFVHTDGLNMFRLPVSWQYLTNNTLGGALNPTHFGYYDQLVQSCLRLSTTAAGGGGAYCLVDLHNYGRWNGSVIGGGGGGGPSNEQFADLWGQIAAKYANETRVWFGIMNEPHDMVASSSFRNNNNKHNKSTKTSTTTAQGWADSVQAAVTAIRNAGATTQFISLPGDGWQTPGRLLHSPALARVTNPDGSTTGLVFDVHLYLDADGSGTHDVCVTNGIAASWAPLVRWLRAQQRLAVVSETGGAASLSCQRFVCQALAYFK